MDINRIIDSLDDKILREKQQEITKNLEYTIQVIENRQYGTKLDENVPGQIKNLDMPVLLILKEDLKQALETIILTLVKRKNKKSNLYDSIKSPFDDDETILKIIDLYASKDKKGRLVASHDSMYKRIISDSKLTEEEKGEYYNNFLEFIAYPNKDMLFQNIKGQGIEYLEKYDYLYEYNKNNGIDDDTLRSFFPLYPLKRYKKIFQEFESYYELKEYMAKNNMYDSDLIKYSTKALYPKEYQEELHNKLRQKYTEEQIEIAINCLMFDRFITNSFSSVSTGSMGFHVNKSHHTAIQDSSELKSDIKLYINAGVDTYKVAHYFQEECEKKGLNYYYKVIDGSDEWEVGRIDRMCIYCPFEDVSKYISILENIRKKYPEISFQRPPITTGLINDYIGVAQDKGNDSYNSKMSTICFQEIKRVLFSYDRDKVPEIIRRRPDLFNKIKTNIKERAKKEGHGPKICIYESDIEKVKSIQLDIPTNNSKNESSDELEKMLAESQIAYRIGKDEPKKS